MKKPLTAKGAKFRKVKPDMRRNLYVITLRNFAYSAVIKNVK